MTNREEGASRREWGQRILDHLKKCEPCPTMELIEKLKVPKKEERTFYRAIADLRSYGLIEGDTIPRMPGHKVEEVKVTVGPRALRLEIPLKTELARKLLNDRPLIRRAILTRQGFVFQILTETGLLEKDS
jgi:hypothetical protein